MMILWLISSMTICFFFNDTATTEIYTLSLHDALPILHHLVEAAHRSTKRDRIGDVQLAAGDPLGLRSEEHTSELQSQSNLVCRLLLEKENRDHSAVRSVADVDVVNSHCRKHRFLQLHP